RCQEFSSSLQQLSRSLEVLQDLAQNYRVEPLLAEICDQHVRQQEACARSHLLRLALELCQREVDLRLFDVDPEHFVPRAGCENADDALAATDVEHPRACELTQDPCDA